MKIKRGFAALTVAIGLAAAGVVPEAVAQEAEMKPAYTPEKRGEAPSYFGGLYSRPVWRRFGRGTAIGGYMDAEFRIQEPDRGLDQSSIRRTFRQVRFIPFIFAEIAPGLRMASEMEIEFGGIKDEASVTVSTATGKGNADLVGEVLMEFAVLDYQLHEAFGLRMGYLLLPLGRFNLIHDSPVNDLTDRPLVARRIIPTTLADGGAGVFGTFYPKDVWKVDYELYAVNGFNGGTNGDKITANGIRGARQQPKVDANNAPSFVGRVGISPRLGYEIGFSGHHGLYDNDNSLSVFAVDWGLNPGRGFELVGEYAHVLVERNAAVAARNAAEKDPLKRTPPRMWGYYVEARQHFLQDKLRKGSTFTGAIRWEQVQTNTELPTNDVSRLTLGLNFRPVEETVFRVDYQFNFEDGAHRRLKNDGINFSAATYF